MTKRPVFGWLTDEEVQWLDERLDDNLCCSAPETPEEMDMIKDLVQRCSMRQKWNPYRNRNEYHLVGQGIRLLQSIRLSRFLQTPVIVATGR